MLISGTIFFMDNLDDMMKTAEKKDRLLYFLEHFCKDIKSMGTEVFYSVMVFCEIFTY